MSLLTEEKIKELAHRRAWRYKKSSDPHHSDTYTFNDMTLIDFVRAIEAAVLEAQGKQEPVACPDKGPWSAGKTDDGRVYIESEDFEHDVRLYVDGDFAPGDMKHYAERMAAWMNAAPVVQPGMMLTDQSALQQIIAAALYDFGGFITTRQKQLVASSTDNAADTVEALKEFMERRGINPCQDVPVLSWQCWIAAAEGKKP